MQRTLQQNKQLYALFTKLNMPNDVRQDLAYQYSQGQSSSTKDLTQQQAQQLINHLNHLAKNVTTNTAVPQGDKMRKKILSICHEMNFADATGKLNMANVNAHCIKVGYLHKPLNAYTTTELPYLVTQYEQILKTYYATKQV